MVNTVDPLKLTYVFTNDAELSFQEKSQFIIKGLVQNMQDLRGLALNPVSAWDSDNMLHGFEGRELS